jgi:ubiquinone/menaquinone biosynthesis C-methylase UbiE
MRGGDLLEKSSDKLTNYLLVGVIRRPVIRRIHTTNPRSLNGANFGGNPMPEMSQIKPEEPNVGSLLEMQFAMAPTRVLSASVQLGIFSHIADGNTTAQEIAKAAGASERGTRMLLDALAAFRLVNKSDGHYELTPLSSQFLVRSSPNYAGAIMETNAIWELWSHLTDAIRTGKPLRAITPQQAAEEFFPILVRSLHILNWEPARRLAAALGAGGSHQGLRAVDIACGSGVWGIAVAEADRDARVTAQDFPNVLKLTREYLRRHGVEDRYDFLPGDLKQVDFSENQFDLALLGNICHSEGEKSSRDLFKRLHRALRPRGRVAIIDMVPNEERTGPVFPIIFALNMLLHTEEGGTYTLGEYEQWLKEAGFDRVETAEIGLHSPIIIGVKG